MLRLTDCLNLVSTLSKHFDYPWEVSSIIEDIKNFLDNLNNSRFLWIPNSEANHLACTGWNEFTYNLYVCGLGGYAEFSLML